MIHDLLERLGPARYSRACKWGCGCWPSTPNSGYHLNACLGDKNEYRAATRNLFHLGGTITYTFRRSS
jgi:hypothetical protein